MKISKHQIKRISAKEAAQMFALLTDTDSPGENMPEGLFLWRDTTRDGTPVWTACDNLDGYAWTEDFHSEYEAEHWLLGW